MQLLSKVIVSLLLCMSITLQAQDQEPLKVGLVLSGGGAKGLAHIGVIKVLEEAGIRPDFISGTSMGSIVGGLYAMGYSIEELEEIALDLDWDYYLNDAVGRDQLPVEEKRAVERYQLSLPIEEGKVRLPRGILGGNRLQLLLSKLTLPAHQFESFDDFPIPFRCVATDLENGDAVVFSGGSLTRAIRASMAIPVVFEPVEFEGKILADGMLVRNLPVQDVLEMGANFIIAIDVGDPTYTAEQLTSFGEILMQITSYGNSVANQVQCELADIVIDAREESLTAADFDQVKAFIQLGMERTRLQIDSIKLQLQERGWREGLVKKNAQSIQKTQPLTIGKVKSTSLPQRSLKRLLRTGRLKCPVIVDPNLLEEKFDRIFATGAYDNLQYLIVPDTIGTYEMIITGDDSRKTSLNLSAGYDSDFQGGLLVNITSRGGLLKGSVLSVDARASEYPAFIADYRVKVSSSPTIGMRIHGRYNTHPGLFYNNFELLDLFRLRHGTARLSFYTTIARDAQIEIGTGYDYTAKRQRLRVSTTQDGSLHQWNSYARLTRDIRDRKYYPTRGSFIQITGSYLIDGISKQDGVSGEIRQSQTGGRVIGQYDRAISIHDRFTMHWYNAAGYANYSDSDFLNLFYLGRDLPYEEVQTFFAGLRYMEQPANYFGLTGVKFQWEIWKNQFLTAMYNYGYFNLENFNYNSPDIAVPVLDTEGHLHGIGLEAGMVTQLGPIRVRGEYLFDSQQLSAVLMLGYTF